MTLNEGGEIDERTERRRRQKRAALSVTPGEKFVVYMPAAAAASGQPPAER